MGNSSHTGKRNKELQGTPPLKSILLKGDECVDKGPRTCTSKRFSHGVVPTTHYLGFRLMLESGLTICENYANYRSTKYIPLLTNIFPSLNMRSLRKFIFLWRLLFQ